MGLVFAPIVSLERWTGYNVLVPEGVTPAPLDVAVRDGMIVGVTAFMLITFWPWRIVWRYRRK